MAKLTKSNLADIQKALDHSIFGSLNFTVSSGTSDSEIVSVSFIDDPAFSIRLVYETRTLETTGSVMASMTGLFPSTRERTRVMIARHSPGKCVEAESTEIDDFSDFLKVLTEWLPRITKELSLTRTVENPLPEYQSFVNTVLEERFSDSEALFSIEEQNGIRSGIKGLQEELLAMSERIDGNEAEIKRLTKELSALSAAASTLPKRVLVRAVANKAYEISVMAGASVGQKALQEAITKILPPP